MVIVFIFAPGSIANEWVPAETIKTLQAPVFEVDRLALMGIPDYGNEGALMEIREPGKLEIKRPTKGSSLNEWAPLDSSGMRLLPYYP